MEYNRLFLSLNFDTLTIKIDYEPRLNKKQFAYDLIDTA